MTARMHQKNILLADSTVAGKCWTAACISLDGTLRLSCKQLGRGMGGGGGGAGRTQNQPFADQAEEAVDNMEAPSDMSKMRS